MFITSRKVNTLQRNVDALVVVKSAALVCIIVLVKVSGGNLEIDTVSDGVLLGPFASVKRS